jgi:hypothetical protein
MTDLITSFLKNLGCSYCQEYNFEDNKSKRSLWKMYLKEYEMYSSIHLYNDESKKDISEIIKKNDVISLFDESENIKIKLEFITMNDDNTMAVLVPSDEYSDFYSQIESMNKVYDDEMKAFYIDRFYVNIK